MFKGKNKGENFELKCSYNWHRLGVPLLISSRFLRKRACGQVDVALLTPAVPKARGAPSLYLFECKSGRLVKQPQRRRLDNSARLLSALFNRRAVVKFISPLCFLG